MYQKYEINLWTDEMVFVRAAAQAQYNRYCAKWRETFINLGPSAAAVYLPAINALRSAGNRMDKAMPPL